MKIKELDLQMGNAMSEYANDVQDELIKYKELSQAEKELYIIEVLDEMNRHNYYAMQSFRRSIVEYLKTN